MKSPKLLILKLSILLLIAGVPYLYLVGKKIITEDTFYWKTTSRADHLIIGGSRIQKGISPSVISEEINLSGNFVNLAFTLVNSPYGTYYNKFIKRKLHRGNGQSVFILEVNSGLVMDFEEERRPREQDFRIYDLFMVNCHPNIEYFIRNSNAQQSSLKNLLTTNERIKNLHIHRDGWVEFVGKREFDQPFEEMRVFSHNFIRSTEREKAFKEIVQWLTQYGKVFLVRLPVHSEMSRAEDEQYPFFKSYIFQISQFPDVYYLDYTPVGDSYDYYDSYHHLSGESARAFSRALARDIRLILD